MLIASRAVLLFHAIFRLPNIIKPGYYRLLLNSRRVGWDVGPGGLHDKFPLGRGGNIEKRSIGVEGLGHRGVEGVRLLMILIDINFEMVVRI